MNYGVCDIGTLSQLIALLPRDRNKYYNISRIPSVIKPYIPPACGCTKDVVSLKQKCKFVYQEIAEGDLMIPVLGLDITIRSLEIFMKPSHVLHIETNVGLIKTLLACGEILENGVKIYHYISSAGDRLAIYIYKDKYFRVKECSFAMPLSNLAFTAGFYEILDETNHDEANMKIPQENFVKLLAAAEKRSNHLISVYIDQLQNALENELAEANAKNEQVKTELKVLRDSVVDIKNKLQRDIDKVDEKVAELESNVDTINNKLNYNFIELALNAFIEQIVLTDSSVLKPFEEMEAGEYYYDGEYIEYYRIYDYNTDYFGKPGCVFMIYDPDEDKQYPMIIVNRNQRFYNEAHLTYFTTIPGVGYFTVIEEAGVVSEFGEYRYHFPKVFKGNMRIGLSTNKIQDSDNSIVNALIMLLNFSRGIDGKIETVKEDLGSTKYKMEQLELKFENTSAEPLYLGERTEFGTQNIRDTGIYSPTFETKEDGSKVCTKPGKFHEFSIRFPDRDVDYMNKHFTRYIPMVIVIKLNDFDKYTYMYCGLASNERDTCYYVNTQGVYASACFNRKDNFFEFTNVDRIPYEHELDQMEVKFYSPVDGIDNADLIISAEEHNILLKWAQKKDIIDKIYTQNYIRKNSIENVWNYADTVSDFYASNSIYNMNSSVKTEGSITYVSVPNTIKAISTPGTKVELSFKKDDADYKYIFMILSIEHTSNNRFTIYTLFDNKNNPTSISSNINVSYDPNTRLYTYAFPSELVFDENTHFSTYAATALRNSYHSELSYKNPSFDQLVYKNLSDNSKNEQTIMDEIYGLKHIYAVIPEEFGKVQGILMEDGTMYEKEGDVLVKPGNITVLTGRFANISSYAAMETAVIKNTPEFMKLKINNVDQVHYFKCIGTRIYNGDYNEQIPYYVSNWDVGIFVQPQKGTTNSFNIYIDQYRKPLEFTSESSLEIKFLNRTDSHAGILSVDEADIEVIPRNIYDELIRNEIHELRNDAPVDIRTIIQSGTHLKLDISDASDDGTYRIWNNVRLPQVSERFHPGSWCYIVTTDNEIIPYMYAYYKDTTTTREHVLVSYNKPVTKLGLISNGLHGSNLNSIKILNLVLNLCKLKELCFTLNYSYDYTINDSPIGALFTNAHRAVADRLYNLDNCLNWGSGTYSDGTRVATYDLIDSNVCTYNSSSKQYTIQTNLSIDSFDMPGCIELYADDVGHIAECFCIKMVMENDVYVLTCMTTHPEIPEVVFRLNESDNTLIIDGSNLTNYTLTEIEIYNNIDPDHYERTRKVIGGFGTTIRSLMKQVQDLKAEVAALKSGA